MVLEPVPTIEGARVRLRPYRRDDADAMYALYSDPEVTRYWSTPTWTDRAQADEYLEPRLALAEAPTTGYPWAIATRNDDALIGTVTLYGLRRDQLRSELGYSLARRYHGRGLASEALRLALGFAFGPLGLEKIEADIDPRNAASVQLVVRLGFQQEGLLRARWRVAGEVADSAIYGLLRREYVASPP